MWGRALGNRQGRAIRFTALWLCVGGGLREGPMPLPGFWQFAHHLPCVIDTLPAVAQVLNPRGGGSAYILSLWRPFKGSFLKIQQFLLSPQSPLVFTDRSYGDLSSWHWNPELCHLAWGWDACSQGIPPNFNPPQVNVGLPILLLPPLCPSPHLHPSYLSGWMWLL